MVLQTLNLAVGRRSEAVVSGICLSLAPGEFVGLLGPNGAGKSTILATLGGILAPVGGRVLLFDRDLGKVPPKERARLLTFLPQNPGEDDGFTVLELVDLGRTPYRPLLALGDAIHDRQVVEFALKVSGTSQWRDRKLGTLSGGERQRVRIAMALAQEPRCLLADEPTTALDLAGQLEIMALLSELAAQGLAVLAVLHDLNLAAQFCSRLVLLGAGCVLADGPPGAVLTEALIAAAYGAQVQVLEHPHAGVPLLVPRMTPKGTDG